MLTLSGMRFYRTCRSRAICTEKTLNTHLG